MTDAAAPRPLLPIAAAFAQAEEERAAEEAAAAARAQAERERADDAASIRRTYAAHGLARARRIGKVYGWTPEAVQALCEPPAPRPGRDAAPDGGSAPPPAPPADPDAPPPPKKRRNPVKLLPASCPVIPLGMMGGTCFYLNPQRELIELKKHGPDDIRALFAQRTRAGETPGGIDWLWETFAKFNKQGEHSGWDVAHAAESLVTACAARGVFDPGQQLRGPGAWTDEAGGLVLHCGDAVWTGGDWQPPGVHDGFVYPGARPAPRPMEGAADGRYARQLVGLFDLWPWQWGAEPDVPDMLRLSGGLSVSPAALLLLGWIGTALVGGALDWRPMVWVTGDAGGGKSTLQKLIGAVFAGGLVQSSDATSAGIYQRVGYSSLAVAIDEAEADPFSQKMKHMVELVRQSASGGVILRGSNDAKFKAFTARSAFLLSSIIIPPLNAQDLTRLAILRLGRLGSVTPPRLDPVQLRGIGTALRRRILDGWGGWFGRLEQWRAALADVGHDARGCDQYGALFAMADLLLDTALEPEDRAYWAETTRHLVAERRATSNADTMLDWLLTKPIDNVFRGGQQYTVRSVLMSAAGFQDLDGGTPATCASILREKGIVVDVTAGAKDAARIFLFNQHAGLAELFRGSIWSTAPGAAMSGWQQAVQRLDGAQAGKKFGQRGWSVPALVFLKGADA